MRERSSRPTIVSSRSFRMTAFKNKRSLFSACLLVLLAIVRSVHANALDPTNSARAQSPAEQVGAELPPVSSGVGYDSEAPASPARPSEISVSNLGAIDGSTVGLLDDSNGGLGQDMWTGSSRAELEEELSRIPIVTTDPVVRDLARRVLLTRASVPVGPARRALISIRLNRLLDGGLIDEAGELAGQAQLPNDQEFARVQAEALLYAGRAQDVCSDKTNSRLTSGDGFWLELRAYCYVAAGDTEGADLTRSILDAEGTRDSGFLGLLDEVQSNRPAPPGAFLHPTAVDIFLLRRLGLAITPQNASQLGTSAVFLAAVDPRNPAVVRLSAAEHIIATGAIGSEQLSILASAQSFSEEQRRDAPDSAHTLPFLTRQILLSRAAAMELRPEMKFSLIRRADPALNEAGPFAVFASLEAPNILALSPRASSGQLSWIAARTLIFAGRPDVAMAWMAPPDNPLIAQTGLALDLVAPGPANDSLAQLDLDWIVAHATADHGGWPAATALSLGVWSALGLPIPPDALKATEHLALPPMPFDGLRPSAQTMAKIDEASADPSRRGEAVLRILNAIGPD